MSIFNSVLVTSISFGLLGLKFWALFDALRHSAAAFDFVGRGTKPVWLVGISVSIFAHIFMGGGFGLWGVVGTIACGVYLIDIRHQLANLRR